jgi:hypothetical protein
LSRRVRSDPRRPAFRFDDWSVEIFEYGNMVFDEKYAGTFAPQDHAPITNKPSSLGVPKNLSLHMFKLHQQESRLLGRPQPSDRPQLSLRAKPAKMDDLARGRFYLWHARCFLLMSRRVYLSTSFDRNCDQNVAGSTKQWVGRPGLGLSSRSRAERKSLPNPSARGLRCPDCSRGESD